MQHCQTCGSPARFIQQYGQWWCDRCQRYVAVAPLRPPPPAASAVPGKSYLWLWLAGGAVALIGLVVLFVVMNKKAEKDFDNLGDDIERTFQTETREVVEDQAGAALDQGGERMKNELEEAMKKELEEELKKTLENAE